MMKYLSDFRIASALYAFIEGSMADMGKRPCKISLEIMVWRFSNTAVGREILNSYANAMANPTLWHETSVLMLQNLAGLLEIALNCAKGKKDASIHRKDKKPKLKDLIADASNKCKSNGYNADALFQYFFECRNIYVHSGITPFVIISDRQSLGINDFLKTKFECDKTEITVKSMGFEACGSEGDSRMFQTLCNLILSSLSFYFSSVNPSLSKYAFFRRIGLYISMGCDAVYQAIYGIVAFIYFVFHTTTSIIRVLFYTAFTLLVTTIILLVVSNIYLHFSDKESTRQLTEVSPEMLSAWVNDMTEYEQMAFMADRQSSLNALDLSHRVGDEVLSPSDKNTEIIFQQFKDFPDPTAHPFGYFVKFNQTSRLPIIGWPLRKQWGGEKLFTQASPSKSGNRIDSLPIYEGGYYPIMISYGNKTNLELLAIYAKRIAKYPKLDVLILYGDKANDNKNRKKNLELAQQAKQQLVKSGVKASKVKIKSDMTKSDGITIALGGVSNYTN